MLTATVDEIADATGVTPKQVRIWIRQHGCPVVQEGGKGTGNGALIDAARFAAWYSRHAARPLKGGMADYFREERPGRNPLREMHDVHRRGFLYALGNALDGWANRPEKDGLDYRADGLNRTQARSVAFKIWSLAAMVATAYQTGGLERDIDGEIGGDLDCWLSLLTTGDFRTRWDEPLFEFPPKVVAMASGPIRRKLDALSETSDPTNPSETP